MSVKLIFTKHTEEEKKKHKLSLQDEGDCALFGVDISRESRNKRRLVKRDKVKEKSRTAFVQSDVSPKERGSNSLSTDEYIPSKKRETRHLKIK